MRRKPLIKTKPLRQCFAKYPQILAAYLFGSYAEGTEGAFSDIDIAVLLNCKKPTSEIWKMEESLASNLSQALDGAEVDIITLDLAPLRICFQVITRGKLLYSIDDDARAAFESYTLRRYWDTKKYLDEYYQCYISHLKEGMDETQRREYQVTLGKIREVHKRVKKASEAQPQAFSQ